MRVEDLVPNGHDFVLIVLGVFTLLGTIITAKVTRGTSHQVNTNNGSSLRDAVDRIEGRIVRIEERQVRIEEHIFGGKE
jgi:Na+-translocating ferredoxin:NAD+ oxidoreductase RnfG subunit